MTYGLPIDIRDSGAPGLLNREATLPIQVRTDVSAVLYV